MKIVRFLAADDNGNFLLGVAEVSYALPEVGVPLRVGSVATKGGASSDTPITLGYVRFDSSYPLTALAAAVPAPAGWLIARSARESCGDGECDVIVVTFLEGERATQSATIASPSSATTLGFVRRSEGAWLLFDGSAVRVDAQGAVVKGPVEIAPTIGTLAADALDGGLVFAAWQDGGPELMIGITDDQGKAIASVSLALPSEAMTPHQSWGPGVLFDPATRQALVAMDLRDASGVSSDLYVARFACQ